MMLNTMVNIRQRLIKEDIFMFRMIMGKLGLPNAKNANGYQLILIVMELCKLLLYLMAVYGIQLIVVIIGLKCPMKLKTGNQFI